MTIASALGRRSVVVSVIGITQTLAWGSTYYLTAVFADPTTPLRVLAELEQALGKRGFASLADAVGFAHLSPEQRTQRTHLADVRESA